MIVYYIISGTVGLLITLVGCAWYLGHMAGNMTSSVRAIASEVHTIRTNDLFHIDARLNRIEDYIIRGGRP